MNQAVSHLTRVLRTHCGRVLALMALLACLCGGAAAQFDQGTIAGTVTDASGGVILNAQVTLTSADTGLVLHSKTSGSGEFVFSPIKIGNYSIMAAAAAACAKQSPQLSRPLCTMLCSAGTAGSFVRGQYL
jgi:hypothetical protein